jgi:hypothetical protein
MFVAGVPESTLVPLEGQRSPPTGRTKDAGATVDRPAPFARLLERLGREVEQGEALVRSAIHMPNSGKNLDPADLIALQAGVYRYGEAVDLASRLVDRATASVKTIVQAQ